MCDPENSRGKKLSKKVSVVVITYNSRNDLTTCLESLEKQTYDRMEIIVVDDASCDGTLEFLTGFQSQTHMALMVVTNKSNLGVAGSRNIGIQHASGDIIAFIDADCTVDRKWILELIKGYENDGVAAVGGFIQDARIANIWQLLEKGHDFVAPKEGYVTYIQGCNMSFDRDILKEFNFNEEIKYGYEEALLCDNLIKSGYKIYYKPLAIVNHKRRATLKALLKQKYLRGLSSIWYRKKCGKFFMLKRHFVLLLFFFFVPFALVNRTFSYCSYCLFTLFCASIFQDELIFGTKSMKEIALTFPLLVFTEFFHFGGAIVGLAKFRFFNRLL